MKRWCGVVWCAVVALAGCTGDDLPGEGEGEAAEGEGEGEGEDDIVAACAALDAELGVTRPDGWDPAQEDAAMQADFDDLTGGDGGGGVDVLVAACDGKAIDDACSANGDEPGVCADFGGVVGCFLDSFRTPSSRGCRRCVRTSLNSRTLCRRT